MNNTYYSEISVLIVGYDGYKDVWDYCIDLMNKYWPNRPKTYLVDSELAPLYKNVQIINAGADSEWSKKVQVALSQIHTPYVLLLLEDFFITDYVDNNKINQVIQLVKNNDIKFYQLFVQAIRQTWIKGKRFCGYKGIRIIPKDKKYGLNLQAAIWNREFLKKAVGNGNYNAWEFEIKHLHVNCNSERVECLLDNRNILNITHAVVQSRYLPDAIKIMRKMGYYIETTQREVLSQKDAFKYKLKLFMYSVTPRFLIKPFKAIGRMMHIDFVTDRINEGNTERSRL